MPSNLTPTMRRHVHAVVLLGVEGLAVIDTPDALRVTSLERSSELKQGVAQVDRKHGNRV